jgi:tRNA(Ile)-lysidine synthase
LLEWRRADIDAYIHEHGLSYREDASNTSLEFRRNRLRHEVLPLLNDIFGRDVAPVISRFGRHAQIDDAALSEMAMEQAKVMIDSTGSLIFTPKLHLEHSAILSRIIRLWLVGTLKLGSIDSEVIENIMSMLRPGGPAKINLPGDRHLRRKARRLWVE